MQQFNEDMAKLNYEYPLYAQMHEHTHPHLVAAHRRHRWCIFYKYDCTQVQLTTDSWVVFLVFIHWSPPKTEMHTHAAPTTPKRRFKRKPTETWPVWKSPIRMGSTSALCFPVSKGTASTWASLFASDHKSLFICPSKSTFPLNTAHSARDCAQRSRWRWKAAQVLHGGTEQKIGGPLSPPINKRTVKSGSHAYECARLVTPKGRARIPKPWKITRIQ